MARVLVCADVFFRAFLPFGLCDFKESIGCKCSAKLNFIKELF